MWLFSHSFRARWLILAGVLAIFWGVLGTGLLDSWVDPKDGSTRTPGAPSDQRPGRLSDPRCEPYAFPVYAAPTVLRPAAHWHRL